LFNGRQLALLLVLVVGQRIGLISQVPLLAADAAQTDRRRTGPQYPSQPTPGTDDRDPERSIVDALATNPDR
jgi:hypothetical protein